MTENMFLLFPYYYLHFKAYTSFGNTVCSSGTCPQVCKPFNGKWVATVPVSSHLEMQVAVICIKKKRKEKCRL